MSAHTQALGGPSPLPPRSRKGYWQRFGGKFLMLSIAVHLLFFAGAAYFIIEYVVPKKQPVFIETVPSPSIATQTAQHNASEKKQLDIAVPPAALVRAVSTNRPDLTIPDPPPLSQDTSLVPGQMSGPGGFSPFGPGGPGPSSAAHTIYSPMFTTAQYRPGMLKGTFYDFKFRRNGQPSKDPNKDYADDITHFVMNGWNDSELDGKYLKGGIPLYAAQVFFPVIDSNEGPKEFHSPKPDSPGKWVVVFKGDVSPPESGTYHFVAAGDDDMIIRFDGKTVLFHCEHIPTPSQLQGEEYNYAGERLSYARSLPLNVDAGKTYPIEVLIGDDIPNKTFAKVLIEKEGVNYAKDGGGGPVLPVFAVDAVTAPDAETPAHLTGPIWHGKASSLLEEMFDK